MTQYKYTAEAAAHFNKHGIDLTVYGQVDPSMTVAHVSVAEGHFQEFYSLKSTYTYYIISGYGTFYLNDEAVEVKATDLVVVPPVTRIYYFGTMEMTLTVSPAFDETHERHVRFLEKNQIPNTSRP
ncbi:cupin domain-containing protein [Streptomyces sp. NPDC056224]|uniref:cupin domain-containing protein n=1 Tax=Streptomyces sp. NPDC056224 TaxID=3345750 RepID=UPI0035E28F30